MNNFKKHFDKEIKILENNLEKDDNLIIKEFIPKIYEILEIFATQGHSGFSASSYANTLSDTIKKTLLFEALSPLTGKDAEWNEVGYNSLQNNRESSIFKDIKTGKCHYIHGIVWKGDEPHDSFTGVVEDIKSSQIIKEFPFIPKIFYIDVCKKFDENGKDYEYYIKDRSQLDQVRDYYDLP